jgi:hypothetical protein
MRCSKDARGLEEDEEECDEVGDGSDEETRGSWHGTGLFMKDERSLGN